jgi:DNA-binding HxlR family transcriptional regulator
MMQELDLKFPTCPVRNVLARFSDKWSLLVLVCILQNGKMRYTEIRRSIPDISQKMLSSTLKHLEEDNLLVREAYAEIPPRVEYSLSETGESLMLAMRLLLDWSLQHFQEVTQ